MAKTNLEVGARTLKSEDDIDFLSLITPLNNPLKFKNGKKPADGGKKGNDYWLVSFQGAVGIIEHKSQATMLDECKVGKASIIISELEDAEEGKANQGLEISKLVSSDVVDVRHDRAFKREMLTVENFKANPNALAQLQGLTVNKVHAIAEKS